MTKLFDDTLFDDTITINKREYNAADVALYVIMMDDLVAHTHSDFIRALDMELRVMLSCMSIHDVKMVQYHKEKVMQEFDRKQLRSRIIKKRMLWRELNEKEEFEKSIKMIEKDNHKPNKVLAEYHLEKVERMPEIESFTDEPDEILF